MRRDVGFSAGLVALLVVFFHIQAVPNEEGSGQGRSGGSQTAKQQRKKTEPEERTPVEGPWLATRAYFNVPGNVPDDKYQVVKTLLTADGRPNCKRLKALLGLTDQNEPRKSWSMVLTVPDPLRTRMGLFLDGQVETVERSLQAAGWDFAQQWLPWQDQFDASEGDIESRRKQRRLSREQAELPGILLFRSQGSAEELFSVFVVPETATAGINGPAFFAAMHMASALTTAPTIGLLGPTFSGSLPSLGRLARQWKGRPLSSTVYSGVVSNSQYAKDFLDIWHAGGDKRPLEFHGGTANADDYFQVACDVMHWYHIDPRNEAAMLREDESGMSTGVTLYVSSAPDRLSDRQKQLAKELQALREQQIDLAKQQESAKQQKDLAKQRKLVDKQENLEKCRQDVEAQLDDLRTQGECLPMPRYVFPRDISHLRNAYQETGPPARDPYGPQAPNLSFSIRDPNSGEDSIPTFSNVQTPLEQDAILSSITAELNRKNTRMVIISAASVLDTLFLMRVIHQEVPNTRIMLENPSTLLIPAAEREGASGTIVLSSYPMFEDGEEWLDGGAAQARDRLRFGESNLQGLYNVSQLLLQDLKAIRPGRNPDMRAYRVFHDGRKYPGVWVLMLNRLGFAPLRLEERRWKFRDNSEWMRPDEAAVTLNRPAGINKPVRGWRITVLLTNAGIVTWCFLFVWCNVSPEKRRPLWLAVLTPTPARLQALLVVCLSMTLIDLILLSPALKPFLRTVDSVKPFLQTVDPVKPFLWPGDVLTGLVNWFGLLGLAAPMLTLGFLTWLLQQRRSANQMRPADVQRQEVSFEVGKGDVLFLFVTLGIFATIFYAWLACCYGLFSPKDANTPIEQFFFRYRAMDPYSGSSPAPPIILLSLIFLLIALLHFERYTLAGRGRPRLKFVAGEARTEPAETPATRTEGEPAIRDPKRVRNFYTKLGEAQGKIEEQVLAPARLTSRTAWGRAALGICLVALCWAVLGVHSWQAFELRGFNVALAAGVSLALFWLAMECFDLFALWKRLQKMLRLLEYMPLEPALERITRDWPRRPIWAFRKAVAHERVAGQMLYALHGRHMTLEAEREKMSGPSANAGAGSGWPNGAQTTSEQARQDVEDFMELTEAGSGEPNQAPALKDILRGRAMPGADQRLTEQEDLEKKSADLAGRVLRLDLRPSWRRSGTDEILRRGSGEDESPEQRYDRFCADFFALHCSRYVVYCVEHIQRIASCISVSFVLLLIFFNSYSPQSPQLVARFLAGLFLAIGYVIVRVFAEMERNPFLSRISRTKPGELNRGFWVQLLTLGGLPLLGVLAHLFPSVSQFLFRWIAPGVQAVQ